ncbi:unnamed protein product [Caenorhabditis bovis]|uniref:Uncharacterized protein n=1 Tax=Caenorhabditis bovis TaxID=2654633 RepID=A0A8S1EJ67_9PELO|nr:unnamed protein product [Caenorhabditis bovis]
MRILSAFFAVLFTFINPTMIVNVISQIEAFFATNLPDEVKIKFLDEIVSWLRNLELKPYVYSLVIFLTIGHIAVTCFSLYGIYSVKAKFMKPLIFDIFASLAFLLFFVLFSLFMYWRLNTFGSLNEKDTTKLQLRNMYIGVGFLIVYLIWAIVTCLAHSDTHKLRADFMYWIEEERMSMRSRHNVSVDNRSDRSSKGSKVSRASRSSARSAKSAKSEAGTSSGQKSPSSEYQKVAVTPCNSLSNSKKQSVTNARLSVPL